MVLTVKHSFINPIPDVPADVTAGKVTPSRWNADHTITGTVEESQLPVSVRPYEHSQASSASTWSVAHNMGRKPQVQVRSVGGVVIADPEVQHLSDNTLQIIFDEPFAGFATLT